MRIVIRACIAVTMLASLTVGQTTKSWTEWSKKEVEKTLNDSAWGQTQSEGGDNSGSSATQTSAITSTGAARREDSNLSAANKVESGEVKAANRVKYHVRFLSAKPVREAYARMVQLAQAQPNEALTAQLQSFVDRSFADYIVLSVAIEVSDQKMGAAIMQAFSSASTEALKEAVYLERKDGKKLFLMEYRAPGGDGMGAKFVFERVVDGQPFLSDNDSVRFVAQLNPRMKLNTRYKVSDMMYQGKIEY